MPALLTKTSRRPTDRSTAAAASLTLRSSATSRRCTWTSMPARRSGSAAARAFCSSRALRITIYPRSPSCRQTSRPSPRFAPVTSATSPTRRSPLPGDPALAVRIPPVNLAVAKLEEVAAVRVDPRAVGPGGEHRPLRDAAVARDEVPGVLEPDVGQQFEEVGVRLPDLGRAGVPASPGVLAAGRFVHALRGHHVHDRIEVVAAPRGDVGDQEIVMPVAT